LIHEQAGPRLLGLTRLGIFALWTVKLLLDPLWRLAELPRAMFQPVGVLNLISPAAIDLLLRPRMLFLFLAATLVVTGLAMLQRGFLLTSTLAAILLTGYSSLIRSFGPAVHTDIVLLLAVYALAGFAWADFFQTKFGKRSAGIDRDDMGLHSSVPPGRAPIAEQIPGTEVPGYFQMSLRDKKTAAVPSATLRTGADRRYSYPLITIVAMLCLSYCLVGLNRVLTGGITVFTGDTMEVWAVDASLRGYYFNTNVGWHIPEWPAVVFLLRSGLPFITLFEITAPLCVAVPHYRWIFMPVMLSFHAMSLVFMNIFFFDDMFLYLLLIDWSRRFPALARGSG
jgi:hypothetical protein